MNCAFLLSQLSYTPLLDESVSRTLLSDEQKQEFFLITNLKMVLVRFITSGPFDPATISESLKRSFYFSVEDWDVLASCSCNGQASKCDEKVTRMIGIIIMNGKIFDNDHKIT